jgi:uncharacterized protein (TIGR02246 family)
MNQTSSADLQQSIQRLEDEASIRALGDMFSDAANRKDGELFASLWAPQGEWIIGPPINRKFAGRDNMAQSVTAMLNLWDFFVQMTASGIVHVQGDKAYARFYVNEIARAKDQYGNYNLSMYDDELIKIDGAWYFLKREYKTIYQDSPAYKGLVQGAPAIDEKIRQLILNRNTKPTLK